VFSSRSFSSLYHFQTIPPIEMFKGIVSRDEYYIDDPIITKPIFCLSDDAIFEHFFVEKINQKFLRASIKSFTYSEIRSNTL
jgi:hypothetical protein